LCPPMTLQLDSIYKTSQSGSNQHMDPKVLSYEGLLQAQEAGAARDELTLCEVSDSFAAPEAGFFPDIKYLLVLRRSYGALNTFRIDQNYSQVRQCRARCMCRMHTNKTASTGIDPHAPHPPQFLRRLLLRARLHPREAQLL